MDARFPSLQDQPEPAVRYWPNALLQTVSLWLGLAAYGHVGTFTIAMALVPLVIQIASQATISGPVLNGHVAKSDVVMRIGLGLAAITFAIFCGSILFSGAFYRENLWISASVSTVATGLILFREWKPFPSA